MNNKIKISLSSVLLVGLWVGAGMVNAAPKSHKAVKTDTVKEEDEVKSPLGCRDVGYSFELKVLKILPEAAGERNSLYFIFNKLDQPLKLFQMRKEDSTRSLYLNHTIESHQWAVLSTSEKHIKYICAKADSESAYGDIVDCADSLKVCEYARVKFGLNNRGNLWLVNSNNKNGAVREVVNYGIIPR